MSIPITCTQAKQIDLVEYLQSLGHVPEKIRGNEYWYLSPLRDEKTASFKVDRRLNVWYDHGIGQGGDLIDFGTSFHNCSVSDLLSRLSYQVRGGTLSFHTPTIPTNNRQQPFSSAGEKKGAAAGKVTILSSRTIEDRRLIEYLNSRCISLEIANLYCREIDFSLHKKQYRAIGFANYGGGYELRSKYFKCSSSPKAVTFIDNNSGDLAVFEGFFNFLSYVSLYVDQDKSHINYLILNSLAFFQKSIPLMQRHEAVNLYLDRDAAGMKCTEQALQISPRFKDDSYLYEQYKDLNQYLISHQAKRQEKTLGNNKPKEITQQKKQPREFLPYNGKGRSI